MRVLYLTKYAQNAASSRLRSYQYFPFLKENGIQVEASPLFSKRYLEQLYAGKPTAWEVIKGYLRRFFKLFSVKKYQVLVIEKELFPYLPAFFERMLTVIGIRYMVDYDDAIFHNYDRHPNKWVRKLLGDKIDRVMRYSDHVVAGNDYLASRARQSGAKQVVLIPTVIDIDRYPLKKWNAAEKKFIVGWIGTQSTFEKHFMLLKEQVQKLTSDYPHLYFHIIGAPDNGQFNNQVRFIPWSEETEVTEILRFDVGLMPLSDSDWEKGKCAYKLIQYMACGVPGLASAVGANLDVVNAHNGFVALNLSDFEDNIKMLLAHRSLLAEKGMRSRLDIQEKYTLQVQQSILLRLLYCVG